MVTIVREEGLMVKPASPTLQRPFFGLVTFETFLGLSDVCK